MADGPSDELVPGSFQNLHGRLGWIRQTKQIAHLLELGFMQGKNDDTHLDFLAVLAAKALAEAFTGREEGAPAPADAIAATDPSSLPGTSSISLPAATIAMAPILVSTTGSLRSDLFANRPDLEAIARGHRVLTKGSSRLEEVGPIQDALNRLSS